MSGLLYPAYQKFYSAISCLERFRKEQDFFENISCLDTFFSEYRSITLVMQKSLAHTPYIDTYKSLVATGCLDPWLNTQRVKSVHTHPVEFTKKVDIIIYFPDRGIDLLSESFSVEDDVPLSSLEAALKAVFARIDPVEVFFSAACSFPEKETGADVLQKAMSGLFSMRDFMDKMHTAIGEDCHLCNQLREKISHSSILHMPMDFLTIDDYVYYPIKDEFERGGRLASMLGSSIAPPRTPLKSMSQFGSVDDDDYFQKFAVMHITLGTTDLMPTFMVVYKDSTFQLITFHADIKTTFYRKINEVASIVMSEDVQAVYCMMTYVVCDHTEENMQRSSKERMTLGNEEFLTFMKVDAELNEEEYFFDAAVLGNREQLARHVLKGPSKKLDLGATNMMPIISAFKTKRDSEATS